MLTYWDRGRLARHRARSARSLSKDANCEVALRIGKSLKIHIPECSVTLFALRSTSFRSALRAGGTPAVPVSDARGSSGRSQYDRYAYF